MRAQQGTTKKRPIALQRHVTHTRPMGKQRVVSEAQMLVLVKKRVGSTSGTRITKADWASTRRAATNKTGWNMARFEAWAAKQITEGAFTVAAGTTTVSTAEQREEAALIGAGGAAAAMGRAIRSVRAAATRLTEDGHVSAAMVTAMEKNLKRSTQKEVGAAMVILAAGGELTIKAKVQQVNGEAPWAQAAMDWATSAGWMNRTKAQETLRRAAPAIVTPTLPQTTVIELGSGWGGATEGLRRVFDRVVTLDRAQHAMGRGVRTRPDILAEFQRGKGKTGGLVRWAARRSRTTEQEQAAVWASPSCTEESTCQGLNKGKSWGKGKAAGKRRSKDAVESMTAVIDGLQQARERNPRFQYVLENVAAAAQNQAIVRALGEALIIPECVYGRKSGKKYAVWMSPEAEALYRQTRIAPTDPRSRCETCKHNLVHEQAACPQKGDTRSRVREPGQTTKAAANRVPPDMAEHLGWCMRKAWEGNQNPGGWRSSDEGLGGTAAAPGTTTG